MGSFVGTFSSDKDCGRGFFAQAGPRRTATDIRRRQRYINRARHVRALRVGMGSLNQ
jgi:hypothetical protein